MTRGHFKNKTLEVYYHITDNDVMCLQLDADQYQQGYIASIENTEAYSVERLAELLDECDLISENEFIDIVAKVCNRIKKMMLPTPKTIGSGEV